MSSYLRWPLILVCALLALARGPELVKMPLVDQANFMLAARELAGGRVLYRDLADIKPPLIFWTYLAVRQTAGDSYTAIVAVDTAVTLITVLLVIAALRRRVPPRALIPGLLLWGVIGSGPPLCADISMLQPETLQNLFVAITLYLVMNRRLGGVLLGVLAFLGALAKVFPGLMILVLGLIGTPAGTRRRTGLTALAVLAALGGLYAAHLASTGALDAFRAMILSSNQLGRSDFDVQSPFLLRQLPLFGLSSALAALALLHRPWPLALRLLLAWLAMASAQIFLQGRYWGYHFLCVLPPIALVAGFGLHHLRHRFGPAVATRVAAVGLIWQLIVAANSHLDVNPLAIDHIVGRLPKEKYEACTPVTWQISARTIRLLSAFIESRTRPTDPVFVFGIIPQLFLCSGRPMMGPFLFHYSWLIPDPATPPGSFLDRKRQQFLEDFDRSPPAVVVVPDSQAPSPGVFETGREIQGFPRLLERLKAHYQPFRIEDITVFVRPDGPRP